MAREMSPKERVLTAFAHAEPDRVPIDYESNPEIDLRLKRHYGLAAEDDEGLRRALGVDFRRVGAPYAGPELHEDVSGRRISVWGIRQRWIEHETGGYWDYCDFPLRETTMEEAETWPMPDPDDFDYDALVAQCDRHANFCVVLGSAGVGDIINSMGMLRTMEQVLVDLVTDDEVGLRLIDRKFDIMLAQIERSLEAGLGKIDMLMLGEDLGTQKGPLIGIDLFRKHIRPRHQRFVDLAKAHDLPVMIHSCGSSSWAFEDFIEMGIHVVDTLQPEAADMAPAYLKRRFGGRLAFHGMISTAGPVAYGTPEDVVRNVRETLDIMMPGGGYALAPTHQLQSNSPTENVVAMYDAAKEYGRY